jgi:hypothetical protein
MRAEFNAVLISARTHFINRRLCKRAIWDAALGVVATHRVAPCASGATTRGAQIARSLRVFTRMCAGCVALLARSPATRRVARLASTHSGENASGAYL